MSNRNNMIPIPGRLHSVAVGEPVSGADEVLDDALNMEQSEINQLTVGTKNASTGTTGAYPYNGMGRVVLPKNMVNGVNTLTQDMLYKGDPGSRVPNTNTIYVIRYDFTLGEDITVHENCVLEFDGGSINGNGTGKDTITGTNTQLRCYDDCLHIVLDGTFVGDIYAEWFGVKSGSDYVSDNNTAFTTYIIPSMENVKSCLSLRKETSVYFSTPLTFNGTYDLNLKGKFYYSGQLLSTAISIGSKSSGTNNTHNYYIESLDNTDSNAFYNDGVIVDNIGVSINNVKISNITINRVRYFAYCIRLYGNVSGCASNKINFNFIGGRCYYGIHCLAEDDGWVNENYFLGKGITSYSGNPAAMCAVWFEARNSNYCNGNFLLSPSFEGVDTVMRLTNATKNTICGARAEEINKSIDIYNGVATHNTILYNYARDTSYLEECEGNNRAIMISRTGSELPLLYTDNFNHNNTNYKLSLGTETDSEDNTIAKFKLSDDYTKDIFGKFVQLSDKNKNANIIIRTNSPGGRFVIAAVNKNYSSFLDITTPEDAESRGLTEYINANYIKSTIDGVIQDYGDIKIFRTGTGSSYIYVTLDKDILRYGANNDIAYLFIGIYTKRLSSEIHNVNIFSDNLCISPFYANIDKETIKCKTYFNLNTFSLNSFLDFEEYRIYNGLAVNNTLDLSGKTLHLYIGTSGSSFRGTGTVNVSGATVYPNFNAIMDYKQAGVTVSGMPAAGTLYWQNGKPTWSNGTQWVDATGTPV